VKETLRAGLTGTFRYKVPASKTVPRIHPEAPDFQLMPKVLATGYLVALCEWAAIELIKPHLDWPREQSVGTHVNLSHTAATPPGFTLEITVTVTEVQGRMVAFSILATDGVDPVTEGFHQRHVIDAERFNKKLGEKAAGAAT
jgi:fluoroacetyl-CoA thioesterase